MSRDTEPAALQSRREWDTTIARGIAALLIVNSHLENFYPISWLADGGQIGNIGFFFISGLGLGLRPLKETTFPAWYYRRLHRIYPAVWISLIVAALLINGRWRTWDGTDYFEHMIWPMTGYHFLERILIYYLFLYVMLKALRSTTQWLVALGAVVLATLTLAVATMPAPDPDVKFQLGAVSEAYKWPFYFSTMLAGVVAGRTLKPSHLSWGWLVIGAIGLGLGYLVSKYLMVVAGAFTEWYPLQGYLTLTLCGVATAFLAHPTTVAFIERHRLLLQPLAFIGVISLELYLVHFELLHSLPSTSWGPFPLNAILFLLASVAVSAGVHWASGRLRNRKKRSAVDAQPSSAR